MRVEHKHDHRERNGTMNTGSGAVAVWRAEVGDGAAARQMCMEVMADAAARAHVGPSVSVPVAEDLFFSPCSVCMCVCGGCRVSHLSLKLPTT